MKESEITYDIVKNEYTGYYVVFKTYGGYKNFKGVFHSKSRKECLEYIKNKKEEEKKEGKK